jgi:hypothetical protein
MYRLYIVDVVNNIILKVVEVSIIFLIHTLCYLSECKQRVYFGWSSNCKFTQQIHKHHDPRIKYHILLFRVEIINISFLVAPSLSFDIFDKWNIT